MGTHRKIVISMQDREERLAMVKVLEDLGYTEQGKLKVCGDGICGDFPKYSK